MKDPRVDAYIARSAPFARPILRRLRRLVHAGCPGVEETLKWGFPHFMHNGILCSMASFKAHCAFGFWKQALLARRHPGFGARAGEAMGQFGRIASAADLPDDRTILGYVRAAAALNEARVTRPAAKGRRAPRPVVVPSDFRAALLRNRAAAATFAAFSPSQRREYVDWVTGAKRAATHARRIETAMRWLAEGKVHNWRYAR